MGTGEWTAGCGGRAWVVQSTGCNGRVCNLSNKTSSHESTKHLSLPANAHSVNILNKNHDHRFKQVERWVGVFVVPQVGGGVYPGCMPSGGSRRVDIRVHEQIDQLSRRSWSKKLVQEVGPRSRRRLGTGSAALLKNEEALHRLRDSAAWRLERSCEDAEHRPEERRVEDEGVEGERPHHRKEVAHRRR